MSGDLSGCFESGPLVLRDAALFTDLYEITMAASYFREGMNEPATFHHVSLPTLTRPLGRIGDALKLDLEPHRIALAPLRRS